MSTRKNAILTTLLFLFLSIILPMMWMRSGYLYTGEESLFANYGTVVNNYRWAWSDKVNYGAPVTPIVHSVIIPNGIFYKALEFVGVGNVVAERLFVQVTLFIIFLAISRFLRLFTDKSSVILIGSIFYAFSFFTFSSLWYTAKTFQLIMTPLLFVLFYNYLRKGNYIYAVYNFLVFFILQGVFINLPQLLATMVTYIVSFLFFVYKEDVRFWKLVKTRLLSVVLFFIPLVFLGAYHATVYYYSFAQNFSDIKATHTFQALNSPLHRIYQMRGSWWESEEYEGISYNHLFGYYESAVVVVASYAVFLFVFLPLIKKYRSKDYKFFLILFLVSLAITSGTSFYPNLYRWVYSRVPYFYMFREPWSKFMPLAMLAFSAVLVQSFEYLNRVLNRKHLIILVGVLVLIRSGPFFTPSLLDYSNKGWKKLFIRPAEDWIEFDEWSNEHADSYVLPFPLASDFNPVIYKWNKGDLGNSNLPMYLLFGNTNVLSTTHSANSRAQIILSEFIEQSNMSFVKIFPIDYLLVQGDSSGFATSGTLDLQRSVKDYFSEEPVKVFGDWLDVREIKPEHRLEFVYSPQKLIRLNMGGEDLPEFVSKAGSLKNTVLMSDEELPEDSVNVNFRLAGDPTTTYEKISPSHYRAVTTGVEDSFVLVLRNSYSKFWNVYPSDTGKGGESGRFGGRGRAGGRGYIDGGDHVGGSSYSNARDYVGNLLRREEAVNVDNAEHFVANGYSNGWVLDADGLCSKDGSGGCVEEEDGTRTVSLDLKYSPQKSFSLLFGVNVLIFTAFVGYLSFWAISGKRKNLKNLLR
jgi:hypothetical protein